MPDAPVIWNNLARIRSWLADDAGAIEAFRRYAALSVPQEDAVEAEATAMFLSPSPLGDEIDVLRWSWPVRDAERLQELLLSDRRIVPTPVDRANWPMSESPPPRMTGALLDRPALREDDAVTRDTIPPWRAKYCSSAARPIASSAGNRGRAAIGRRPREGDRR